MKKYSALTLMIALAVGVSQLAQAQGSKEAKQAKGSNEANRLAREGAEASKSQDWDKAVDLLRKATNLDHKYAPDLAIAYQGRGYAYAKSQQYQEAIQDFTEAAKIKSNDPRIYEQRAAVEMKTYDYDKALADYSELIKLKPSEVRYLNYRAYIYETKDDLQNAMADNEKVLKIDPNNQEAKGRKQRVEQKLAERTPLTPPPGVSPASSPKGSPASSPKGSPPSKKKPSPG
jgi:tetratricopeptide (TPR) repeat protein